MSDHDSAAKDWIERLADKARILGEARMLRDDQDLTSELTAAILTRFGEYLLRTKTSQEKAAKSMGIAPATLSAVLNGNYAAEIEPIVRKIDKWTDHRIVRESAPKDPGFVKTSVARQIYGVAKYVHKIGCIGLITGPSGSGKTRVLRAIQSDFPGSVYISITRAGQSTSSLLKDLADALRLPGARGTAHELEHAVRHAMTVPGDHGRFLLVDEIHRLAGRRKDEALHTLRDLHDHTGSPMLWSGMNEIARYIESGKNRFDVLEQIDSRINYRVDLTAIAMAVDNGGPGLHSIKDIEDFLASQKIRVTSDALAYLHQIANEPQMGGLRAVSNLLKLLRHAAEGQTVTAKLLRSAFIQSRDIRFVERFETRVEERQLRAAAG